jgi:hypothetical protein
MCMEQQHRHKVELPATSEIVYSPIIKSFPEVSEMARLSACCLCMVQLRTRQPTYADDASSDDASFVV